MSGTFKTTAMENGLTKVFLVESGRAYEVGEVRRVFRDYSVALSAAEGLLDDTFKKEGANLWKSESTRSWVSIEEYLVT